MFEGRESSNIIDVLQTTDNTEDIDGFDIEPAVLQVRGSFCKNVEYDLFEIYGLFHLIVALNKGCQISQLNRIAD